MEMRCPVEELDVLHPLGEGCFGRVFSMRSKTIDDEEVLLLACKVFDADEASDLHDIVQEISIMQTLRKAVSALDAQPAPPVVLIHGYHVGLSSQDPVSYITMDLCDGGSLSGLLKECTRLSEAEAAPVLSATARALLFCHEQAHILHRDIKPANILFSEQGNLHSARLADFGISVHLDGAAGVFYGHPGEGSRAFMAPEAEEFGHYSAASDTWGLGAVLFYMLTGMNPPRPRGSREVNFVKAGDRWSTLSSPVRSLIQGMLCSDRHNRLTLSQVLRHPWLTDSMDISADKQEQTMQACTSMGKEWPAYQQVSSHLQTIPDTMTSSFSLLSLAESNVVAEPQPPKIGLQLYAGQPVISQAAQVC